VGAVVLADKAWEMLWWGGLAASIAFIGLTALLDGAGKIDLSPGRSAQPDAEEAAVRASAEERQRIRAMWLTAGVFCLWSTQMIAYLTWLPEVMVSAFGFTPDEATIAYSVPIVTLLVFNIVGGVMLRRGMPVALLLAGSLGLQLAVWVALPWTGSDWTGVVSLIVYGVGSGITPTCLWSMPSHVFGARAHQAAFAALMTGRSLGALVGPLLLAQAFALTSDWNVASPLFAVATGIGILGALFLHTRLRHLEPTG
jgi:predicted MFS family arabinose efflux permease